MDGSRVNYSLECFEKHAAYEMIQKENGKNDSLNNRQSIDNINNHSIYNLYLKCRTH